MPRKGSSGARGRVLMARAYGAWDAAERLNGSGHFSAVVWWSGTDINKIMPMFNIVIGHGQLSEI